MPEEQSKIRKLETIVIEYCVVTITIIIAISVVIKVTIWSYQWLIK